MSAAARAADGDRPDRVLDESECLVFQLNGALVSILPWSESGDGFLAYVHRPGELVETEVPEGTVELLATIEEGDRLPASTSPAWSLPAGRLPEQPKRFSGELG